MNLSFIGLPSILTLPDEDISLPQLQSTVVSNESRRSRRTRDLAYVDQSNIIEVQSKRNKIHIFVREHGVHAGPKDYFVVVVVVVVVIRG
jgi:hypothetical protein